MWDKCLEDVARYVAACVKCQKSKGDRHGKQTKLAPMPTQELSFEEIAIDFVGELPESETFHAILVVIDWFTKVQPYISAKTTWTTENVADSYINYIWNLHSLPRHLSSDRGPHFASKFLKELIRKLNITLHLATAYHP